jgi:hypothetical protein
MADPLPSWNAGAANTAVQDCIRVFALGSAP